MDKLGWDPSGPDLVIHGDNLQALAKLPDESFRLIYIDPPFNTGRVQSRQTMSTVRSAEGTRKGFQGRSYETVKGLLYSYDDSFADYWDFLEPRLEEAWRLLDDRGTLYLHLDFREVHYAKVVLDALFGREHFLNEIIWAYDYGARAKNKWPAKHDTILVYVKNPKTYFFDNAEVDREPYMAPGLVTPEKVALGRRSRMISSACGFCSTSTNRRPSLWATAPVVPLPAKKSRTQLSGALDAWIMRRRMPSGFWVA